MSCVHLNFIRGTSSKSNIIKKPCVIPNTNMHLRWEVISGVLANTDVVVM